MKSTGSLVIALFLLLCAVGAHAADVTITTGRSVIAPGESTQLVITVTGGSVDIDDTVVPRVDGLVINYTGKGSSFEYINGRSSSSTTLSFSIYGEKEGNYTIPSFTVNSGGVSLNTRPVKISVKKGTAVNGESARFDVSCDVELSAGSCYTGQPVIIRYYVYHDARFNIEINNFSQQPVSEGFIVKKVDETVQPEDSVRNGQSVIKEHVISYCIIPEITGTRTCGGGTMVFTYQEGRGFFSRTARGRLSFPEKKLTVLALPSKGKPAGYGGDVGDFKLEAVIKSGSYMVNQEIQVPVTVTGRGNFFVISKPVFENTEGIKVLVEESDPELALDGNNITGTKKFLVTIIPQAEGNFRPGILTLKYFNPLSRTYVSASSEPLSLEVSGIAAVTGEKSGREDDSGAGLPVFAYVGVGALIAAAFFGLVYIIIKEKRRYSGLNAEEKRKTETAEEKKDDPLKLLRDELEDVHAAADRDGLLKIFFRASDMLNDTTAGKSSAELAAVRAKLDAARFANASLSDDELEEVYCVVSGLLTKMK